MVARNGILLPRFEGEYQMERQYEDIDILEIKRENQQLKQRILEIQETLQSFYEAYSELIKKTQENADHIALFSKYTQYLQANCANLKYELMDPTNSPGVYFYPKFRSNEETIRLIVEERKSLARFGDGEFSIAFNVARQKFQRMDDRLAMRIREVLTVEEPQNLLIGIAKQYGSLDRFNEESAQGIRLYMTEEIRRQHQSLLSVNRVYSDAYITRPYVIYRDVFTDAPAKRFGALKQIWRDKRIILVEGAQTRLGVGNDLFEQARDVRRIIAPPTSSFDRYDEICRECLNRGDSADLFLLAIGPASGVLAYDLALQSYQAVDVGHIDLEYEWFLAGKGTRVSVPYKYNNEFTGGDRVDEIHDPVYDSQIIVSFI